MNEPPGRLPKAVYLRRRVLAVAGSTLAVLLLIWVVGALFSGDSKATGVPAAALGTSTAPSPMRTSPSAAVSTSVPTSASASGSSSASPSGTTSLAGSSATASTPTGPPGPCPDATIRVTASADRSSYRVGERPVFTLTVTNTGTVACVRDLSRPLRSLRVVPANGGQTLWSSADCYTVAEPADTRTLRPGQSVGFSVIWAGRTSAPGCPADRGAVPAGQYAVTGRLGALTSAPVPFALTA